MIKHILTLVWNKKRSNVLMFLEIFVAFLILFAVFSLSVYYMRNFRSPLGFKTTESLVVYYSLDESVDSLGRLELREQLRREVEAMPEVHSASFLSGVAPFSGSTWSWSNDENGFLLRSLVYPTDENYAEVADLNLVKGRWYTEADRNGKYEVAVVNQLLKDTYFPDRPIVDSVINLGGEKKVLGIVDHFKYRDEFETEEPLTFMFYPLHDESLNTLQVRLHPDTPVEFEQNLNQLVARITNRSDFVINSLETSRIRQSRTTWVPMIAGLSICAFLILNIALGLFGVLFYSISKRRAEIGLRRALGASQAEITSQFTFEVFLVAFLAMLLAGILAVQFPLLDVVDIPSNNFYWAILLTFAIISFVVLACAFVPSRQAAGIHPAQALHEE